MNDLSREAILLGEALALPSSQRGTYLDQACRADAELRRAVQALLDAHEDAGAFLGTATTGGRLIASAANPLLAAAENAVPVQRPGERIGRYKLLEQIGEGGCGVVFMAEQEEPVRRRVALKIIKLGMDTKEVIARFEAERQALAMMDHPNIAKVLDAGATERSAGFQPAVSPTSSRQTPENHGGPENANAPQAGSRAIQQTGSLRYESLSAGRPYFVMELVRGIKITEYCDQNNLTTKERLDLFMQVCRAIQHAHQKGIIHRDVKPSNILVTLHDGVPVPKVIDFGIAKATQGRLTDQTLFTAFQQFIGTPAYMSPEQAEMSGLDIDTRSDIYSLGVLLYELLTGKTPFDGKELLAAGVDAMRKTIREREPQAPSTRLSTMLAGELTATANHRQVEAAKLPALVRGDLDWIVMKCLEKDRTRRYETANGLATDIQRHLGNEAVLACPPSNLYRLRKVMRRNKLVFAAGASVAAALVIGLGVATWMFFKERAALGRAVTAEHKQSEALGRALAAEQEQTRLRRQAQAGERKAETAAARSEQIAQFLKDMLQSVGPSYARGRDTTMLREVLDNTTARIRRDLTNQFEVQADLWNTLGTVYRNIGQNEKAEVSFRNGLAAATNAWPGDHPILAELLRSLSKVLHRTGGSPLEAERKARQALEIDRRLWGKEHPAVAASLIHLGWAFLDGVDEDTDEATKQARAVEAERFIREGLAQNERFFGKESSPVAASLRALGRSFAGQRKWDEGAAAFREARRIWEQVLREEHRDLPWCLSEWGGLLEDQGDLPAAEALFREVYVKRKNLMGVLDPDMPVCFQQLSSILKTQGKFAEQEALAREWIHLLREAGETNGRAMFNALGQLVSSLSSQGKEVGLKAVRAERMTVLEGWVETVMAGVIDDGSSGAIVNWGSFLERQGRLAEQETLYRKWVEVLRAAGRSNVVSTVDALHLLAQCLYSQRDYAGSESACRERLALLQEFHTDRVRAIRNSMEDVGVMLENQGKSRDAEAMYRQALIFAKENAAHIPADEKLGVLMRLAKLLSAEQNHFAAESFYREACEIVRHGSTNDAATKELRLTELAGCLRAQKKYATAEQYYREALPYALQIALKPPHVPHSAAKLEARIADVVRMLELQAQTSRVAKFYHEVVPINLAERPECANVLCARGGALARNGRWNDAIADFQRAIELQPTNDWYYHQLAPLLVAAGDTNAYHLHCRRILQQFKSETNAPNAVKPALILASPETDLQIVNRWADSAVATASDENARLWSSYHKALAEYRRGRFRETVAWAEKVAAKLGTGNRFGRDAGNCMVLAMARHRLGHAIEAQAALLTGSEIVRTKMPRLVDEGGTQGWVDTIVVHTLMQEAKALVQDNVTEAKNTGVAGTFCDEALATARRLESNAPSRLEDRLCALVAALDRLAPAEVERFFREFKTYADASPTTNLVVLTGRGAFLARWRQWKDSAKQFRRAIQVEPNNHSPYHLLAPVLVAAGDIDAYQRHCQDELDHFAPTKDPLIADRMAEDCLILSSSGVDLNVVTKMAETAASAVGHRYWRFFIFCKALASYRRGDFTNAVMCMSQMPEASDNASPDYLGIEGHAVLAMAQYRLGQTEKAKRSLKAMTELESKVPNTEHGDIGRNWNQWVLARAFANEAKALIEGDTKAHAAAK